MSCKFSDNMKIGFFIKSLKRYLKMSKQVILQGDNMSTISQKMSVNYDELLAMISGTPHTDEECIAAFVAEMNRYASLFGMTNTHFVNSSGMDTDGHYSCAKDLAKMVFCCTAYDKLMMYWGQESYSVEIGGNNARTITGVSTYKGADMETLGDYYHIFGGKSGTWIVSSSNHIENLILVCKSKVDDAWLAGCIMYNTYNPTAGVHSNRGVPFKEMLDWLEDYRVDPSTPAQTIQAQYCSAFVVPPHNPIAYQDVDLEMVGKSSTTQAKPASCTKLMTAMVALDHLSLDETITIKSSDIKSGSGNTFYDGDTINSGDAILAMLLPSSNTLATTLARVVGEKILNGK